MHPKIYLGQLPETPQARRLLRDRGLELRDRLSGVADLKGVHLLLHVLPGEPDDAPIDLLLLCPEAVIVGAFIDCNGPITGLPDGRWIAHTSGQELRGPRGETPLERIRRDRDQVIGQIARHTPVQPGLADNLRQFDRTIGALICTPAIHPDTRIVLDVDDHRSQIKLLGLDELAPLAAMVRTGVQFSEDTLHLIITEIFSGRLWHSGERQLFEPAASSFRLVVLKDDGTVARVLLLLEGANVIGRRPAAQGYEYRLVLSGDELMSNDHALIECVDDGRVLVHDTSTNGTWISSPDYGEERLYHAERAIAPGAILRMGNTRTRLEREQDR